MAAALLPEEDWRRASGVKRYLAEWMLLLDLVQVHYGQSLAHRG